MNYFDANTWTGRWPFAFLDVHSPQSLAAHLAAHGIRRALVSPLDAVFAPAPGPANRELLRDTREVKALLPVPVINPALANWREELAACGADPRVQAVKLLPAYHNYRLTHRAVDELAHELIRLKLRLIVQVRLIDERHEYHALTIKPVPAKEVGVLMKRHPKLSVLASGLVRTEIFDLVPKFPRLLADLSLAEWHETMIHLLAKVPARQLAFASHTPFLISAAARAKLQGADIGAGKRTAIAAGNLAKFLNP